MGFFGSAGELSKAERGIAPNREMLNRHGCRLCPLDKANIYSPKMLPSGSDNPIVYILGEAPGKTEDDLGEQFVGSSGDLLRPLIPQRYTKLVRWNNAINCRPPNNRDPSPIELECCRSRIVSDIERTKPKAIFGFGGVALQWATGRTGISNWRGRRIPVKIGSHECWFYAFFHPSALLRNRRGSRRDIISEDERATRFDLLRAFADVSTPNGAAPAAHREAQGRANVSCWYGTSRAEIDRLASFLRVAERSPLAGVDYETSHKRPYSKGAKLISAAVSLPDETIAFAYDHPGSKWSEADLKHIRELWVRFLKSDCRKISHGLHFELEWSGVIFGPETIRVGSWEDTMTMAHVVDERVGKKVCFGLGFLTAQYFGLDIKTLSHLNRGNMINEPIDDILPYNGIDAKYHRLLYNELRKRIDADNLTEQYSNMLRRVHSAVCTQIKGFPIDLKVNQEFADKYQAEMDIASRAIAKLPEALEFEKKFGKAFNPGAPKDVGNMLFTVLGVDKEIFKDDPDSTNKKNLAKVNHPITPLIIDYREANKLKSTYCDSFRDNTYPDGLIHQELQTLFVTTSRASSDSPNMKNLPKRDEDGKLVRKQFRAPPGYLIVTGDYAQIQVRNVAMESRDPVLTKYIWDNHDMHGEWAEKIAYAVPRVVGGKENIKDKDVMKAFRNTCKSAWTFCLLFGGQLYTAANYLNVEEKEIAHLYDEFWHIFSGVHKWHLDTIKMYEEVGYVENLSGMRRRAPVARNQLINAPIQADEAVMVWDAFNRLTALEDPSVQPINEIYDDLTFLVPEDHLEEKLEIITAELTRVTYQWVNVPTVVELSVGESLYDLTEVAKASSLDWHRVPARPNYSY